MVDILIEVELSTNITAEIARNYAHSYETNGVHFIRFFKDGSRFITYEEFLKFKKLDIPVTTIEHLGIKLRLTEDVSLMTLATSHETTNLGHGLTMQNISLQNTSTIFKYMNPPFIAHNHVIAEFFHISENLFDAPKYVRNYLESSSSAANIDNLLAQT